MRLSGNNQLGLMFLSELLNVFVVNLFGFLIHTIGNNIEERPESSWVTVGEVTALCETHR